MTLSITLHMPLSFANVCEPSTPKLLNKESFKIFLFFRTFSIRNDSKECRGQNQNHRTWEQRLKSGNTKGGSITVPLTSCLTGWD